MEHLLRYAVLALLDQPQADLRDIVRLYVDKEFRKAVVAGIRDEQVRAFWTSEFPSMNYVNAIDGVAPIANKLGAFLAHPVVRAAICEPEQPLRFRRIMDQGEIVIVNLAKGRLGTDMANVLGGLITAMVMHAAFSRHDSPEQTRRPFILYVDEFPSFTTQAFANLLPEARKYGLGLTLAHQHVSQVESAVFDAVLGYAEIIRRRAKDGQPHLREMEALAAEAERMAEIVRKIGKITRYETKSYVGESKIIDLDRSSIPDEPPSVRER